jgi:hypothetical protein
MSRYERARKPCVRCHGQWRFGIHWPEGYVCRSCIYKAATVFGDCPGCKTHRLLAGRDQHGRSICVDCAGITTCFRCDSCGCEGRTWYSRTCVACSLLRRLGAVLDDGSDSVAPELVPLFERLTAVANPVAVMTWLNKQAVRERLSSLAKRTTPLTHAGVDTLCGTQGKEFLRELLVEVGLLPERHKYLAAFESWRPKRLASIEEPAIRREINLYMAWRHQRNLAVRAEAGRLSAAAANGARDQTDAGVRFLRFLSARNRSLSELHQDDIDAFFAEESNPRAAVDFLTFAIIHRRCGRVRLPASRRASSPGSSLATIRTIVQRLLDDESLVLSDRVAGLLVLLFAQCVTRVVELRVSDLCEVERCLTISLGPDPVPLPEPVAALVSRYLGKRSNTNTTNTATDFLFPGRRPGSHITATALTQRLNKLGITKLERQGALRHLVSEAPSPVVARATGYAFDTTAARAELSGTDWAHYAALKSAALS